MQMGVVALVAFTLLTLLSLKPLLRRMAYEAFLLSHIALALFVPLSSLSFALVFSADHPFSPPQPLYHRSLHALGGVRLLGLAQHVPLVRFRPFVFSASSATIDATRLLCSFRGLDRFVRMVKTIVLNKLWLSFSSKAGIEQRTALVESLHGNALRVTLPRAMSWTPGQHAYLGE